MSAASARLSGVRLYLISDASPPGGLIRLLEAAVRGGVDMFQLREKNFADSALLEAAASCARTCSRLGVPFIVNDRADIALAAHADGVHLGQDDLPVGAARALLGPAAIIGLSTHSREQIDAAGISTVIDTNLNGLFLMTQAALAVMKRGSTIVNNLSIAAERVFPGLAAYNASKHGALGFTNTLREELRPKGIRVIALMTGATDTAIWNTLWPNAPRRKMMSPETIAGTVVHALLLPDNATVEKIVMMPTVGTL